MKIKTLISIIVFSIISLLFTSFCFATENTTNNTSTDMQNMVNTTSSSVGNVMEDIGNGMKEGAENLGNTISNIGGGIMDTMGMNTTNNNYATYTTTDDNYTATRTSATNYGNSNLFGMNESAWTWIIMGIVGIAIIGIVWYYAKEHEQYNTNNHDNY